jgi:hypothetical protein
MAAAAAVVTHDHVVVFFHVVRLINYQRSVVI